MKTLRLNKVLRGLGVSMQQLETVMDIVFTSPNQKIIIGLESDMPEQVLRPIQDMTIAELTILHTNIEKEITDRINQIAIAELESELRSKIWALRDLGVNTLAIDGLSISLEPTFNYNPES